jgi:hypothetical protein
MQNLGSNVASEQGPTEMRTVSFRVWMMRDKREAVIPTAMKAATRSNPSQIWLLGDPSS